MADIVNIRPGDIITVLSKATDVRGDRYNATVSTVVLPERGISGGIWTVDGRWVPAARIEVKDDSLATLVATTAAKSEAHTGLAAALEYGTIRVLRVDGVDRLTATYDGNTFTLRIYPATGMVSCNGYITNSTCRDLAHAALKAYRSR
jgi:hypothetical protein